MIFLSFSFAYFMKFILGINENAVKAYFFIIKMHVSQVDIIIAWSRDAKSTFAEVLGLRIQRRSKLRGSKAAKEICGKCLATFLPFPCPIYRYYCTPQRVERRWSFFISAAPRKRKPEIQQLQQRFICTAPLRRVLRHFFLSVNVHSLPLSFLSFLKQ